MGVVVAGTVGVWVDVGEKFDVKVGVREDSGVGDRVKVAMTAVGVSAAVCMVGGEFIFSSHAVLVSKSTSQTRLSARLDKLAFQSTFIT